MMNSTVRFGPGDSGSNGFTVRYASYPGESAVLEGGVPVKVWYPFNPEGSIWAAPIPAAATGISGLPPRQVYIGGQRMNESYLGNSTLYGYKLLSEKDTSITEWGYVSNNSDLMAAAAAQVVGCNSSSGTAASSSDSTGIPCEQDVEFLYRMVGCQWVEDRLRVQSWGFIDAWNGTTGRWLNISFPQPGWYIQRHKTYANTYPSTAINLLSTLTADPSSGGWGGQPGTGYVSGATGLILYVPRPGVDNISSLDAWVPVLDGPFISLVGDRTAQPSPAFVQNVAFEGLAFQHSTWSHPSGPCGYAPDQSGMYFNCSDAPSLSEHASHAVPGTVQLHTARNVSISGCAFQHVGATGLTIDDGSQDVSVADSLFADTGCHGVRLGQVDDWNTTDVSRQNARYSITNSVFTANGAELRDCSAIMGGYVLNSTISHNNVTDSNWAGITIGWGGWNGAIKSPSLGGNRILNNYISRVNLATADGGPIYVLGDQRHQSEMAGNFVSHALHHAALLYHDEGSTHWWTHDNVVDQTPADMSVPNGGWWWAFLSAWASTEHDILMERITTRYCNRSDIYDGAGNNLTARDITILSAGAAWTEAAQAIIDCAGAGVSSAACPAAGA